MAEAKIKTLYSDKEKTEKLYPRTKIGAISDNDGVGLEAILDNMVYSSNVAVESVQVSLPVDADTLGGHTPDYYATKADLVGLGSETQIVQADWNQNDESAVDYVKNRTHYEEMLLEGEFYNGTPSYVLGSGYDDLPYFYRLPDIETDQLYLLKQFSLKIDHSLYGEKEREILANTRYKTASGPTRTFMITVQSVNIGPRNILSIAIYCSDNISENIIMSDLVIANTIPEKYIPPTIVRTDVTNNLQAQVDSLTPEQIGAAPASGFEFYHDCADVDELNAKIAELTTAQPAGTEKTYYLYLKWYSGVPLPSGRWSVTIHKPDVGEEAMWAGVTATVIASQRIHHLQRELYAGTWLDWEWVDPYMTQGTEYRTDERFNGVTLYKRANYYERSIVQYRLDGEDKWRPYAELLGAALVTRDGLSGYADFNNAKEPGVYYCNTWSGSGGANFPNGKDSGMLIVFQPTTDSFIQQIYISDSDGIIRRMKWADEADWKPWEYETPPMKLATEYRTTERWQGKAVYTQLYNFGTLPSTSYRTEVHGINNIKHVLRSEGTLTGGSTAVVGFNGISNFTVNASGVTIETKSDLSNTECVIQLWYTKTTD